MSKQVPIAVARGDGIGPEIMDAVLRILKEGGAELEIQEVEIGERVYLKGYKTGIEPKTWDVIKNTKAFLKAPITTPQGGGFKSLNVTIRTTLGLYANVRPCTSYFPFIATKHPKMDVIVVRENEEDLYAGIEYRQTPGVAHSIKMISRAGSEKICRFAFEYAKKHKRKKVTCFTKDNIMKLSDGLFHKVFEEVANDYPEIENEHWIVDIGAAKLADSPENFDVLVLPNLYGDILSDVAAQISGSVGLAGSANIGDHGAMFEAIHGSAPRRANQNVANPSGLLFGALQMLAYIEQPEAAERIHNAWLKTIEDGVHTYDIFTEGKSKEKVGTKEFASAVIKRLGQKPSELSSPVYPKKEEKGGLKPLSRPKEETRRLIGADLYVYASSDAQSFTEKWENMASGDLSLQMISNRGVRIWPEGHKETFCIDQWRCRFLSKKEECSLQDILLLLNKVAKEGHEIIKIENLYTFDGTPFFSGAEG
ncbi:MAG: NADP-dependent isocitrate dehydrogenase [Simkaniaceae bacterium]